MKKVFAVIKLNNRVHIGTISNSKELSIILHSDALFENESKALEYIENVNSIELLMIQPVYITSINN
jgi:hypothetical protein